MSTPPPADSSAERPRRTRPYKARLSGQERAAKILEVAIEAFMRSGYEATAMDTIATGADVTRSVLYHFFPSKGALYLAVIEHQTSELESILDQAIGRDADLRLRLLAASDTYLRFAEDHPERWTLLQEASGITDNEISAGYRTIHEGFIDRALSALIGDLTSAMPERQLRLGMQFILSGLDGAARWRQIHPDVDRLEVIGTIVGLVGTLGALNPPEGLDTTMTKRAIDTLRAAGLSGTSPPRQRAD